MHNDYLEKFYIGLIYMAALYWKALSESWQLCGRVLYLSPGHAQPLLWVRAPNIQFQLLYGFASVYGRRVQEAAMSHA